MLELNVRAACKLIKFILPGMLSRNCGYIVNLTSVASHSSYAGGSMYCASKHALLAFARAVRSETCNSKIGVTNISPGMTQTEFSLVRYSGNADQADRIYDGMEPSAEKTSHIKFYFVLLNQSM